MERSTRSLVSAWVVRRRSLRAPSRWQGMGLLDTMRWNGVAKMRNLIDNLGKQVYQW